MRVERREVIEMTRYQIRSESGNGLALVPAMTPGEALAEFLADQARGLVRETLVVNEDGSATAKSHCGKTFTAVPAKSS
jgi:hypothetical protein